MKIFEGVIRLTEDLNKIDEFAHKGELIDWWYFGGLLDKNDTKVSEWTIITNFVMARGFVDNLVCILIPPDKEPIDLSGWGLKAGCITAADNKLNVVCQTNNWVTGAYPNWNLHMERTKDGHNYIIDIQFQAEVDSNFRVYAIGKSKLGHFAVFRQRMNGKLTIDKDSFDISGVAYYEHMYGFIDPKSSRGWFWYCIPQTKAGNLSINIALGVSPQNEIFHKFVYFTEDGKNFGEFLNYNFEILEERSFEGVKYPFKFRIHEKNELGALEAVVTRTSNPNQAMHNTPFGKIAFITGNAHVTGTIEWKGKKFDIDSRSIGSNFLIIY
ncbi:MAG TPA: hypothetical protein VMV49_11695 [Candidatus Deferrimicrobium sp.]|nr:hypothetical protein [Candidatus Deferrimicrobium sp.]